MSRQLEESGPGEANSPIRQYRTRLILSIEIESLPVTAVAPKPDLLQQCSKARRDKFCSNCPTEKVVVPVT